MYYIILYYYIIMYYVLYYMYVFNFYVKVFFFKKVFGDKMGDFFPKIHSFISQNKYFFLKSTDKRFFPLKYNNLRISC